MKTLVAAAVVVCAVLLPCAAASGKLIVGINDDVGYEASVPTFFMPTMQSEGLKMNALTIRWDETSAAAIDPTLQSNLTTVIGQAQAAGITVELDLYPLHSQVFTGGTRCTPSKNPVACGNSQRIVQFADWVTTIAETFPTVHQFIVMNECNQPLFLNPQWNSAGVNQSAAICGRALAAAYDALKVVSKSNFVWGVGLSPRGNDSPSAPSNSSTSPVRFLRRLGAWFKAFATATHRTVAADGRARLPSLPGAAVAAVREGLCEPARRERLEPAADLPGLLRRLQRLAAAHDRPAEGRRAAAQPQRDGDPDRTRSAGSATRGSR